MDMQPAPRGHRDERARLEDASASIGGPAFALTHDEMMVLDQLHSPELEGVWSVEKMANLAQELVTKFDPRDRPPYTQEMRDGFKGVLRVTRDSLVDKGLIELIPGQSFSTEQAPDWALYRLKA